MDNLKSAQGFMPGIFKPGRGRQGKVRKVESDDPITDAMTPKAHPAVRKLPSGLRNNIIAFVGEFVGTFMFLFMAFAATQIANTSAQSSGSSGATLPQAPDVQVLTYIALAFGFSLAVNAWIFYRVSGGLFNPAVTLGLCLIGAVPFLRGALVVVAQILGAMAAAGVVKALFPGALAVDVALGGGTSIVQGLFIEMFLTAQLVFTIFMLAAEKHKATFLAPVGIGLSLFIGELAGVYFTGGALNPARAFGPAVANRSFHGYHWIYWLGPVLGTLLAAGFYWFIKSAEYQTANPGQDFDDLEADAAEPSRDPSRSAHKFRGPHNARAERAESLANYMDNKNAPNNTQEKYEQPGSDRNTQHYTENQPQYTQQNYAREPSQIYAPRTSQPIQQVNGSAYAPNAYMSDRQSSGRRSGDRRSGDKNRMTITGSQRDPNAHRYY